MFFFGLSNVFTQYNYPTDVNRATSSICLCLSTPYTPLRQTAPLKKSANNSKHICHRIGQNKIRGDTNGQTTLKWSLPCVWVGPRHPNRTIKWPCMNPKRHRSHIIMRSVLTPIKHPQIASNWSKMAGVLPYQQVWFRVGKCSHSSRVLHQKGWGVGSKQRMPSLIVPGK